MKNKIFTSFLFWLTITNLGFSQVKDTHHQISVAGGYITLYPGRGVMSHGFSVSSYYQYDLSRWIGIQTGIQYNHISWHEFYEQTFHAPLQLPLNIILFTKFRYSLIGGMYYEKISGTIDKEMKAYYQRNNVWGYELGLRKNWKHAHLRLEFKQALNPWFEQREGAHAGLDKGLKNWTINAQIEIPLWRK